jgi:hypothetical protein
MILVASSGIIKIGIHVVVPLPFRVCSKAFSLNTIGTIVVRLTLCQTGTYFCHEIAVQYLLNGLAVQIAQHVGIAGTTSFDIATWVNM